MKTGAVVVLYFPIISSLQKLLASLNQQVDILCLVDNSPKPLPLDSIDNRVRYFHFSDNCGVAEAQNVGLKYLTQKQCDYALLLDQDSLPDESMVEELTKLFSIDPQPKGEELIAVGPAIVCEYTNQQVESSIQKPLRVTEEIQIVRQIIASGMLIDLAKLPLVGFKNAGLFIDGVDHEWCWRAQKLGFTIGQARNAQMLHRLGDGRKSILGFKFKIGAPIRLYYQFRNILVLLRLDYVPSYWKFRNILALPCRFVVNSIFLEHRVQRINYMLKGLIDGIKGRKGKFKHYWGN